MRAAAALLLMRPSSGMLQLQHRGAQPRSCQPTSPAGPSGVRGRIPPVRGRLRQGQRTGAAQCGGGRWQALRGAFERGRQSTPLHMVNVWAAEARMCSARARLPAAARQRGVGSPGPAGPRRLYRYRGCTALPSRLCLHGARAGCGLRAGAQGEPEQVVRAATRRYARSRARSVAERREPATHDRCEGDARPSCAYHFRRGPEVPRRRCAGPHHSRRRVLSACASLPVHIPASKYILAKQLLRSCAPMEDRETAAWILDVVFTSRNRIARHAPENLATVRVSGPFNQRGGVQIPTVARTSHKPRNARLADLISEADQTYDPYS